MQKVHNICEYSTTKNVLIFIILSFIIVFLFFIFLDLLFKNNFYVSYYNQVDKNSNIFFVKSSHNYFKNV